jgi:hypothetical protein
MRALVRNQEIVESGTMRTLEELRAELETHPVSLVADWDWYARTYDDIDRNNLMHEYGYSHRIGGIFVARGASIVGGP